MAILQEERTRRDILVGVGAMAAIIGLLISGTVAEGTEGAGKASILIVHAAVGTLVLLLTLARVAWCTGGAQGYFEAAIAAGADAYLTGEISEPQAHIAREMGVAYLAAGHHATERYGAPAVAAQVAEQHGLRHVFIDIENPA